MSIGLGLSGPEFASLTADQRRSEDDAVSDLGSRWSASRRGGAATPSLTRLNGLALVISLQIGSGIFSAPSQISQHVTAPGNGLLVWVVGGVLVWTGAASFIELGLRIPSNGGIQEYLRTCYGDFMGFMFAWSWIAIAKPAANAVGATIFADYVLKAIWPFEPLGKWTVKWVAIIDIAVLTFVNCLGATTGAKAANIFSLLKISALGSIVLIGFIVYIFGYGDGIPVAEMGWFGLERSQIPLTTWQWLGNFCTALFGALFCYGGWETVGFVLGDMANPEADLPVIINVAMTTVIIGFFAMNMALYICLPMEVIRGSTTVAVEFARRTVGGWAGLVFSVVVALSAMGALNANLFATAKLCVAAAHRRYFPAVLANLHCSSAHDEAEYLEQTIPWLFRLPIALLARLTRKLRWQQSVPILALLLNGALASLYVLVGSFNALVTFIGMCPTLLVKESRRRLKGSMARYNTWTLNPIIFAAISGLLILRGIIAEPIQGLAAIVVGLFGLMIFCLKFGLRGFSHFGPV
ncbi:large neutral amino acids transporter small subunit 1 [Xylariales sp. PMI_506]|nr:large neutral amino acids transporter small subunit 1 [Xylariales sp. PMI_506]